jgi:DNA-binding phage protein
MIWFVIVTFCFSPGNPSFATVQKVMNALGYTFSVVKLA